LALRERNCRELGPLIIGEVRKRGKEFVKNWNWQSSRAGKVQGRGHLRTGRLSGEMLLTSKIGFAGEEKTDARKRLDRRAATMRGGVLFADIHREEANIRKPRDVSTSWGSSQCCRLRGKKGGGGRKQMQHEERSYGAKAQ